jgi:RimJ/RimL family protein N-acetyltransferase
MKLRLYEDADLDLTRALESDPAATTYLGGPNDEEAILKAHRRRTTPVEGGDWWFVIELEPGGERAGTIGVWPVEHEGTAEHEVGWMVRPELHGRGIGTEALVLLLAKIRSDPRFGRIHAFPNAANEASNALCRSAGFTLGEEIELDFRKTPVRCTHWTLET